MLKVLSIPIPPRSPASLGGLSDTLNHKSNLGRPTERHSEYHSRVERDLPWLVFRSRVLDPTGYIRVRHDIVCMDRHILPRALFLDYVVSGGCS